MSSITFKLSQPIQRDLGEFFLGVMSSCLEIMASKNRDYGKDDNVLANFQFTEDLGLLSTAGGILVRMADKVSRLATWEKRGALAVVDEGADDALKDIINYAILALYSMQSKGQSVKIGDYSGPDDPKGSELPPEVSPELEGLLYSVAVEMAAQHSKFGEQDWQDLPGSARLQDIEERLRNARESCEDDRTLGRLSWARILDEEVLEVYAAKNDRDRIEELTQVAAVALSWIGCIQRNSGVPR